LIFRVIVSDNFIFI